MGLGNLNNDDFLPIARPDVSDDEIDAVVEVLRSGWLVYGPRGQRLEAEFAALTGAKHAVAVSSCTAGMHLALLAAGIGPGDEVITSTLTFASTANVILHCGATPVFADVCAEDLDIDPDDVARRITPRTRAIMPVHYGGQACRMDELVELAKRHDLRVIEDAAHAAGARYRGRYVGALGGDAAVFSFYAIKNMTTGEGGMVTTDDDAIADRVRLLRNNGLDNSAWNRYAAEGSSAYYAAVAPGFNYRLTDMQAALGLVQLRRLGEFDARRTALVERYTRRLSRLEAVQTPLVRPEVETNWHLYAIRLRDASRRDDVMAALKARGIGTAVHFLPVHLHPYYRETFGYKRGDYPVAEDAFDRLISLPLFPAMTGAAVDRVCAALEAILAGA